MSELLLCPGCGSEVEFSHKDMNLSYYSCSNRHDCVMSIGCYPFKVWNARALHAHTLRQRVAKLEEALSEVIPLIGCEYIGYEFDIAKARKVLEGKNE